MLSVAQIQRKPVKHIWVSQYSPKLAMLSKKREQLHLRSSSREKPCLRGEYETKDSTDTISDRHWPPQVSRKLSKQRCPLSSALRKVFLSMIWSA